MTLLDSALVGGALEVEISELLRQRLVSVVPVASPAAGADWQQAVPAGKAWEVLTLTEQLVTSAAVANREIVVQAKDPNGNLLAQADSPAFQTAGLTTIYSFERGRPYGGSVQTFVGVLPAVDFPLPEGSTIGVATTGLQAADQHSKIVLVVRQWSLTDLELAAAWFARRSDVLE